MIDTNPETVGLFHALYTTRALRRFKPDPVPDELLFQVIDAAIRAPAGGNRQIWHFLVVKDAEKRRQIGEWYWQTWSQYGKEYVDDPSAIDRLPRQMRLVVRSTDELARTFGEVPIHLFVCGPKGAGGTIYPAIQNVLLACRGVGLGSVLTAFHRGHEEKLAALLGIPEDQTAHGLLPIGFPRDRLGPVSRRPVTKVASLDGWGNPWPFAEQQPEEGWRDRWVRDADASTR
jgi:nitroreductase